MQNFTPDMNDDELDRLFREAAAAFQPKVPPDNWQEIARRLDPALWAGKSVNRKRSWPGRRRLFWIGITAAAAAGWLSWKLWLQPQVGSPANPSVSQSIDTAMGLPAPAPSAVVSRPNIPSSSPASQQPVSNARKTASLPVFQTTGAPGAPGHTRVSSQTQFSDSRRNELQSMATKTEQIPPSLPQPETDSAQAAPSFALDLPLLPTSAPPQIHTPVQQTIHLQPADFRRLPPYRWTFGILTGPSWAKLPEASARYSSFAAGWMLGLQLIPRLHLETGMILSQADYNGTIENYHMPLTPNERENIKAIQAACKITDVPLNLQWDIFSTPRQRIFLGAGVSSYFMRKEDYRYTYKRYVPGYPWHVTLENVNTHYFAVGNLSAGFEQSIDSRFSLQAEPYLKLPLSGIGYGQVKLQSFGIWLSVHYHF
ncbi:hypothetical protein [Thermoflavifilum thermophilum]|uniref:Outer membrane protein beta-barrel domain-containing protein n=1 Tax=Thermoflavifilum thermophilum TaxID=1393122 RepID=A0A1I7N673_9BACT|nr:hypothetical protein [Thermoflavifilum thermophilum]SFV30170.1 hypothetical protein SAMN05660895_0715 [Thermoflavifilum thermophilum]